MRTFDYDTLYTYCSSLKDDHQNQIEHCDGDKMTVITSDRDDNCNYHKYQEEDIRVTSKQSWALPASFLEVNLEENHV